MDSGGLSTHYQSPYDEELYIVFKAKIFGFFLN